MKRQEILRILMQEKVQRAMRVDENRLKTECQKLGLSPKTLYDFANYRRKFSRDSTINKLFLATRAILN